MRPSGSPEQLEQQRLPALHFLREGYAPVELARHVGVDRRSVRRWKAVRTPSDPDKIALRLNQRPQETLGFETPTAKVRASVAPIR